MKQRGLPEKMRSTRNRMAAALAVAYLALPFAVATAGLQDRLVYRDPARSLMLYNFDTYSIDHGDGTILFKGTGEPLTIVARESGLTMRGNSTTGSARFHNGTYVLEQAETIGNSQIVLDSRERDAFLNERNLTQEIQEGQTRATLTSSRMLWRTQNDLGRAIFPEPLRLVASSQSETDTQTWTFSGLSADVLFAASGESAQTWPREGTIEGPIEFSLSSTSHGEAEGRADRLVLGVKGAHRTLTMSGNVQVRGTGRTYAGESHASQVVVVLNDDMQPIRYEFLGQPATTRIRPAGGGSR
jgi:hypothetical protein